LGDLLAMSQVDLSYDALVAQEKNGRPFAIDSLRPIQLSKRDVLNALYEGRSRFTTREWKHFLLRSIGLEPTALTERQIDVLVLRMVPFVGNNYNMVELGPRGTGKSHLFQQISPYAHLVSGGKATVARMFVNNATGIADWSASTTWCASTRCRACPSTRRTA
jgi:ATP-dependent Lon protease